jgi:hypothetical protein
VNIRLDRHAPPTTINRRNRFGLPLTDDTRTLTRLSTLATICGHARAMSSGTDAASEISTIDERCVRTSRCFVQDEESQSAREPTFALGRRRSRVDKRSKRAARRNRTYQCIDGGAARVHVLFSFRCHRFAVDEMRTRFVQLREIGDIARLPFDGRELCSIVRIEWLRMLLTEFVRRMTTTIVTMITPEAAGGGRRTRTAAARSGQKYDDADETDGQQENKDAVDEIRVDERRRHRRQEVLIVHRRQSTVRVTAHDRQHS